MYHIRPYYIALSIFVVQFIVLFPTLHGQDSPETSFSSEPDSTNQVIVDSSIPYDTIDIMIDDDELDGPIDYSATDSIVYDIQAKKIYLYGSVDIDYDNIELQADHVDFNWNSYTLTARGSRDTAGVLRGTPVFVESGKEYLSQKMEYNFKTKKGRVYDVITEDNGAFIHSEIVKKNEYNEWFGLRTWYTTCEHEHPHFYIEAKKSKVIPDKIMVTGPANLVVGDIPTPLYLPFGIFPTKKGRRSGIIFPEYGEQPSRGFFLRNGGYYWAVSDYISMAFTTDIYTKGLFGVKMGTTYNRRYKYNGKFNFQYFRTPPSDRDDPNSTGASHDVRITWNHSLAPKANPYNRFSASVTGATSSFNNNSLETSDQLLEVQLTSNINYSRIFPGKPFNISISAQHNQDLKKRTITINAPEIIFNVSRITPFERKIKTNNEKWYERIGFTYSTRAKSQISTADSTLFTRESLDQLKYGIQHTSKVDLPLRIFKNFTFTPSFSYNERWYFQQVQKSLNSDTVLADTTFGFFPVRDFSLGTQLSTAITGIFNFKGKRLKAIRHVMKPSITYTYKPDFGEERWGYCKEVRNENDSLIESYSPYDMVRQVYGLPGKGAQNSLSVSVTNNFEMKLRNRKDTVESTQKVSLIDNFSIRGGYNFAADSLRINPVQFNLRTTIARKINVSFDATLDPYTVNDKNQRINTTVWAQNKRFFRFSTARLGIGGNFRAPEKEKKQPTSGTIEERAYVLNNPQLFYNFNIPWSLGVNYNMAITKGISSNPDTILLTQSFQVSGDVNITPKWKLSVSTGYDFRQKDFTLTRVSAIRDLHCWVLSFNWTAYPIERQTYNIELRVKSQILQELKLTRKQPPNITGTF